MKTSLSKEDQKKIVELRRYFHKHPELKYQEVNTAKKIQEELKSYGYKPSFGMAQTGVVALHSDDTKKRCILLRADMDALPLQEVNNTPYQSKNPQAMHACGHDMHMATLLLTAKELKNKKLPGNLKFVFQPAEEGGNGAEKMVQEGVLKGPQVEAAFGLHVWSGLPIGKVAVVPGPIMASVDMFELTIIGKGGHGAMPHQTVDSIVVASQVVNTLQSVVSRNADPLDSLVVTVGKIEGGATFNIIPEKTKLVGTVRTMSKKMWDEVPVHFERVIKGVCEAYGARYELDFQRYTPVTINEPHMTRFVHEMAASVVGEENIVTDCRTMGGEDFSFFLNEVPGCFYFGGGENKEKGFIHPHHSPYFDIDEESLLVGVEVMKKIALTYFNEFPTK
ncbi:MAG: amidohydrolase [Deltaproteobacteria bacterium]|nr:amidohydrolase [Deltaproteobacteria bacterium]